jgi:(+)-pinoresinol hydroxylase
VSARRDGTPAGRAAGEREAAERAAPIAKVLRATWAACAFAFVACGPALAADAPAGAGKLVYEKWCEPCHAPGPQYPGTIALAALYKGSKPAVLVERTDLSPLIVKQFVRRGVSVMPFFRKTEISDAELDALAAWLSRGKP